MRNAIDFSSWQGVLSTLLGLVLVSLVAVGIRLLVMHGVQQRRERQNRQINERLKTLIAAYKTLGSSFTGELAVDPSHLRDLRAKAALAADGIGAEAGGSERRRRTRDAVEAALSDVILLGTEEQVRLAAQAANDMVAGRPVEMAALVVSLRTFIRDVLDLAPIPLQLEVPKQGPLRASASSARSAGRAGERKVGSGAGGGGAGGAGGAGGGGHAGGSESAAQPDDPLDPAGGAAQR
ncbi:MAG: hypothetical protein ABWZ88_11995 [Variovorax sp.]